MSIYNSKIEEIEKKDLSEDIFNAPYNEPLVLQIVHSLSSNKRAGTANTKTRKEVRGGGKKPWQQKGLGRARHGSRRSPLWTGGGVTFGPSVEKDYTKKLNKKMKAKALYCILSQKVSTGDIMILDNLDTKPKTKEAAKIFSTIDKKFKNKGKTLVLLLDKKEDTLQAFANLPKVNVCTMDQLNAYSASIHTRVVLVGQPDMICETLINRQK